MVNFCTPHRPRAACAAFDHDIRPDEVQRQILDAREAGRQARLHNEDLRVPVRFVADDLEDEYLRGWLDMDEEVARVMLRAHCEHD